MGETGFGSSLCAWSMRASASSYLDMVKDGVGVQLGTLYFDIFQLTLCAPGGEIFEIRDERTLGKMSESQIRCGGGSACKGLSLIGPHGENYIHHEQVNYRVSSSIRALVK